MESQETFRWPEEWELGIPEVTRGVRSQLARWGVKGADSEEAFTDALAGYWWISKQVQMGKRPREKFEPFRKVVNYCITIARRSAARLSYQRVQIGEASASYEASAPSDPWSPFGFIEIIERVHDDNVKRALRFKFEDCCTVREIAERMQISVGQAHKLVKTGLLRLREVLS